MARRPLGRGRDIVTRDVRHQLIPEDTPDHSGILGQALLILGQAIEARGKHRLDGPRDGDLVDRAG